MNYKFLAKNGLTLAFLLGLIGILATMIPIFSGLGAFEALNEDPNIRSAAPESSIFYAGIYVTFILGVIAFGLALVLSLFGLVTNLKESKFALISVAVLAVLFFVLNATASTDLTDAMTETINNPDYNINGDLGIYKWISAGISGTLILLGVAFASWALMEIWNFFKNS